MISIEDLKPGDLLVLPDRDGYWCGSYEYVGVPEDAPDRVLVRELGDGQALYSVRADMVKRPTVTGVASENDRDKGGTPDQASSGSGPGITAAQRKRLFAMARRLGMDIDDLRSATPRGSISALTRAEAAGLIDRLAGCCDRSGAGWRDQGTATGKQLGLIAYYRDLIGFTEPGFSQWLSKRFKVSGLDQITDKALASKVIGGLMSMYRIRTTGGKAGPAEGRGHLPRSGTGG